MNRYLYFLFALAVCITGRAANFPDTSTDGQVIVNSNNTSAGSSSLRWSFTNTRLTVGPTGLGSRVDVESATPAFRLYAGGNPAASFSRLEGFWDSGAQTYYLREITSGSNAIPFVVGINSGATLTFNTDGTARHSGGLGLSATTNRLTIANNTLLLDGVAIGGSTTTNTYNTIITTNLTVLNQLTVSNISVTNITVQNNLTVSNLFTVNGNHNTLIVSNALTLQTVKTNVLATTSSGLITNVNYGTGIAWDPTTLTLSASGSGGASTWVPVATLAFSTTNVTIPLNGGTNFVLTLTNGNPGFFNFSGAPGTASTNTTFTLTVIQDATGVRTMNWDTSVAHFMAGVVPVVTTNASAEDVFTLTTSAKTAGKVNVTWNPDFR